MNIFHSIESLAVQVTNGASIALPPEYSWSPVALVRGLIAKEVRDLQVLCVPVGGITVDMLIGAG